MEAEFDFWSDRLGISYGSYSSEIDEHIYNVAKMIVEARKNDSSVFYTDVAEKLNLQPAYVELINYILAGVSYPIIGGEQHYDNSPFTYGTSPRGLFVGNERMADFFLQEFESYIKQEWEEGEPTQSVDKE